MITIIPIKPEAIEEYWESIRPFIERAQKYALGEYNIFNVFERIKAGAILPLIVYDGEEIIAVLTLEIVDMPLKKILNVMTAGGERMEEWLPDAVKHVDELAKEIDADLITIHGRRGWLRELAKHNYKATYTVLTKEVK